VIIVGLCAAGYIGYVTGTNGALSRSTFINTIYVREEAKCFQSNDVDCLRAHWRVRAAVVAESARRSLSRVGSSDVDAELRSYIQWAEQLPQPTAAPR
jgi:hypothetical protein